VYDATTVPPVTLEWSDVGYTLTLKTGEQKQILKGVQGAATPGRLLAIMWVVIGCGRGGAGCEGCVWGGC